MLKCIQEINEKNKRFIAYFTNGKSTKFGQSNPKQGTFIDHRNKTLKRNYIKRHLKDLVTNDPQRPGYLSVFLLWNKETLKESMKDYNRRFVENDWTLPK